MSWIVAKRKISDSITKIEIEAALIASSYKPGNHAVVTIHEGGEKIPLVISEVNINKGTISFFIHKTDILHIQLANLVVGDEVYSVDGPIGENIKIENSGTVICAASDKGIFPLFPIAKAMKAAGNKVITILEASTKENIHLENEFKKFSDELIVLTNDGSNGNASSISDGIRTALLHEKAGKVILYGSVTSIKEASMITRRFDVPLCATLYAVGIGNSGITGIYNISVCEKSNYICVDGFNFNAYFPDFETMVNRMQKFYSKENAAELVLQESFIK